MADDSGGSPPCPLRVREIPRSNSRTLVPGTGEIVPMYLQELPFVSLAFNYTNLILTRKYTNNDRWFGG